LLLSLLLSIVGCHAGMVDQTPPREPVKASSGSKGRAYVELVLGETIMGATAGGSVALLLPPSTDGEVVVPLMVGGATVGIGSALLVLTNGEITEGQAMTLTGSQALGVYFGIAIDSAAAPSGVARPGQKMLPGILLGSAVGAGLALANPDVDADDVALVRSTALWGGLLGGAIATTGPFWDRPGAPLLAGPMLGVAVGVSIAPDLRITRGELLGVNAAATGGFIVGYLGLSYVFTPRRFDVRPLWGIGTASVSGVLTFALIERHHRRRAAGQGQSEASLGPTVITDPEGRRVPGVVMSGTW